MTPLLGLWVNHRRTAVPSRDATDSQAVLPWDRGLLYGDGVLEVLHLRRGKPLCLDAHLTRLARSARLLGFDVADAVPGLRGDIDAASALCLPCEHACVRVVVSRGGGGGLDPTKNDDTAQEVGTSIVTAVAYVPDQEIEQQGARIISRNFRATAVPGAKTISYVASIVARQDARARGAHEALAVDSAGLVYEGASSNVLCVLAGDLVTPARDVLHGITCDAVMRLASNRGLTCARRDLTLDDLRRADEVILTSTMRGIWRPVTHVDDRPVGAGVVGKTARALRVEYEAWASASCA